MVAGFVAGYSKWDRGAVGTADLRLTQPGIKTFLMCEFCPPRFSSGRVTSEQKLPSHVGAHIPES